MQDVREYLPGCGGWDPCRASRTAVTIWCIALVLLLWTSSARGACADYVRCKVSYLSTISDPQSLSDLAVSGNRAFGLASTPSALVVMDISDPQHMRNLGSVALGTYGDDGVAYRWPYAYVVGSNGFQVVNVGNPAAPVVAGRLSRRGRRVAVSGSNAYVADQYSGLYVIDVGNGGAPALRGRLTTTAYDVKIVGTTAYVAAGAQGLLVVDVTNSQQPVVLGRLQGIGNAYDVDVQGGLAYVAAGASGLKIVDISQSANPVLLATALTTRGATSIKASGAFAYVSEWGDGFEVIDVTNPLKPWTCERVRQATTFDSLYHTGELIVAGDLVFSADGYAGLRAFRVETREPARIIGDAGLATQAYAAAVYRETAMIADGAAGLRLIDLTAPREPRLLATANTPGTARAVALHGSLCCVADYDHGLQLVDIGDPAAPRLLGGVDTPGYAWGLTARTGIAYVADGGSGLQVVDMREPSHPLIIGSADIYGYALDVAVAGDLAFVAAYNDGVTLIDISDPGLPQVGQRCLLPGHAWSVEFAGMHAFVAAGEAGLHVLAATSYDGSYYRYSSLALPGYATGLAVYGSKAFVACLDAGLCVVDLTDLRYPELLTVIDTPGGASGVGVGDAFVCVADLGAGVQILASDCPVVSSVTESRLPGSVVVVRAGPNPSAGRTEFRFATSSGGSVRADIYDLAGRLVRSIGADRVEAGDQAVIWDGRDAEGRAAAAGIYLARITTPEGTGVGRVVLLR